VIAGARRHRGNLPRRARTAQGERVYQPTRAAASPRAAHLPTLTARRRRLAEASSPRSRVRHIVPGMDATTSISGADGVVAIGPLLLRAADITVDLRLREVRRGERAVPLRPKEFDLLVALMRRAGGVVGRRELLHDVWRYSDSVTSRTVDTHVAELRRKLGHHTGEAGHITTVARTGYRMDV
jgi:DNA-binding response OmpR family regulator